MLDRSGLLWLAYKGPAISAAAVAADDDAAADDDDVATPLDEPPTPPTPSVVPYGDSSPPLSLLAKIKETLGFFFIETRSIRATTSSESVQDHLPVRTLQNWIKKH